MFTTVSTLQQYEIIVSLPNRRLWTTGLPEMKNQFLLAFNEICKEKNLPADVVLEALTTALVSAFRRDNSVSSSQGISAAIDTRSGEITILAEKEIVDSIFDSRTEATLAQAHVTNPEAQLGDIVMVDSTPKNFGRIAAQTAKQVILQRVREAEREILLPKGLRVNRC